MPDEWQVSWRQAAVQDLVTLYDWIAVDDPGAAQRLVLKLQSGAASLSSTPRIGSTFARTPESEIRQLFMKPYRLIDEVQVRSRAVVILRIWHGSRRDPTAIDLQTSQE